MSKDYSELVNKLEELSNNWSKDGALDSNWVCVKFPSSMWRIAKKVGAVKDYYYGWILWSASKNTLGSDFAVEVRKISIGYDGVSVSERQL